jgi:hypothetical protein
MVFSSFRIIVFFYCPMRKEETCDAWGPLGAMILERRIRTRRGMGHSGAYHRVVLPLLICVPSHWSKPVAGALWGSL